MEQITTLSFFRFNTIVGKLWAFGMMQFAHRPLAKVQGQQFYRLLGSGKERFHPSPDWGVYAILQIWDDETNADEYFEQSKLFHRYKKQSDEQWVVYLKNMTGKGKWGGIHPFTKSTTIDETIPYLAIVTRATIKFKSLFRFWRYVPKSQKQLWDNPGLIYTKGVGEFPIKQMATFSIWRDRASLDAFAYESEEHAKAIALTRSLDWYKEELFARFQAYRSLGTWGKCNPLPDLASVVIPKKDD